MAKTVSKAPAIIETLSFIFDPSLYTAENINAATAGLIPKYFFHNRISSIPPKNLTIRSIITKKEEQSLMYKIKLLFKTCLFVAHISTCIHSYRSWSYFSYSQYIHKFICGKPLVFIYDLPLN